MEEKPVRLMRIQAVGGRVHILPNGDSSDVLCGGTWHQDNWHLVSRDTEVTCRLCQRALERLGPRWA